jgi:ATP-dependent protease HslVU (ClpYQ) peptidase subunit
MSVIAAVRKGPRIVIAADTQDNFGDLRPPADNHEAIKLREIGGAVLGSSGWALYDDILAHYLAKKKRVSLHDRPSIFAFFVQFWKDIRKSYPFVNDQPGKESETPFANLDASFLVASPGGIFLISSNMSVSEFRQYYAHWFGWGLRDRRHSCIVPGGGGPGGNRAPCCPGGDGLRRILRWTRRLPNGEERVDAMNRDPVLSARDLRQSFRLGGRLIEVLRGIGPGHSSRRVRLPDRCERGWKTTLLYTLAGLERPQSGTVTFEGLELYSCGAAAQARTRNQRIGFVFQGYFLLPELTRARERAAANDDQRTSLTRAGGNGIGACRLGLSVCSTSRRS